MTKNDSFFEKTGPPYERGKKGINMRSNTVMERNIEMVSSALQYLSINVHVLNVEMQDVAELGRTADDPKWYKQICSFNCNVN